MTPQHEPSHASDDDRLISDILKSANVRHRSGMAAELMEELRPLLTADGIDLDDPQANFSLDEMNAALKRATDQRNLSLFTPIGERRSQTINVILQVAEAYDSRGQQGILDVLAQVKPQPTDAMPAHSHVIGASLSMLDDWFTSATLARELARVRVPKWKGAARKVATDVLGLARTGRAFDSLGSLIARRGGEVVEQAALLVVTSALRAMAEANASTLRETFTSVLSLGDDELRAHNPASTTTGSAFGLHAKVGTGEGLDEVYIEQFTEWLLARTPLSDSSDTDDETSLIRTLAEVARSDGRNFHDPDDFTEIVDMVIAFDEEAVLQDTVRTLHEYAFFRYRTDMFGDDWHDVIAKIEDAFDREAGPPAWLFTLLDETNDPSAETWAAVSLSPLVRGTRAIVDWVGKSRPVTSTGRLRRADIEPVAAMIGVAARGVAKLPPITKDDPGQHDYVVQSMSDVPSLEAWWEALMAAGVLELTSSRVKPGETAAVFLGDAGFTALEAGGETAMHVIVTSMAAALVPATSNMLGISFDASRHAVTLLLNALAPEGEELPIEPGPNEFYEAVVQGMAKGKLRVLAQFGLVELRELEPDTPPVVQVADALRGVVVRGVFEALQFLDALVHDSPDDD